MVIIGGYLSYDGLHSRDIQTKMSAYTGRNRVRIVTWLKAVRENEAAELQFWVCPGPSPRKRKRDSLGKILMHEILMHEFHTIFHTPSSF